MFVKKDSDLSSDLNVSVVVSSFRNVRLGENVTNVIAK